MCPSYAFKALLTFKWEVYALSDVGFYIGIIFNLCIVPHNIRIRGFRHWGFCLVEGFCRIFLFACFFVQLHSTAKGIEKSSLFPRQPQKLPMLITQHPSTFSVHL